MGDKIKYLLLLVVVAIVCVFATKTVLEKTGKTIDDNTVIADEETTDEETKTEETEKETEEVETGTTEYTLEELSYKIPEGFIESDRDGGGKQYSKMKSGEYSCVIIAQCIDYAVGTENSILSILEENGFGLDKEKFVKDATLEKRTINGNEWNYAVIELKEDDSGVKVKAIFYYGFYNNKFYTILASLDAATNGEVVEKDVNSIMNSLKFN